MKKFSAMSVLLCYLLIACVQQDAPSLDVKNIRIFAPLPGSDVSVAYFSVVNNADEAAQLINISSPQYGQVAMHETNETDGIARMRPISSVTVPANSEVDFSAGGLHVMLMDPLTKPGPDSLLSMQLQFDDNLLIVSASLQMRRPTD